MVRDIGKGLAAMAGVLAGLAWAPAAMAQAASPWSIHEALGAPASLRLTGTVRARYEAIAGQARVGFEPDSTLTSLRTTLLAEYRSGGFRIGGELYDSRAYGADAGTPLSTGEVNTFEPVQAYVGLALPEAFGEGSSADIQAGRMLLNLGSRRLVAADDYRNTTNSYTGVKTELSWANGVRATLIYVQPQLRLPDDPAALRDNETELDRESADAVLWGGLVSRADVVAGAAVEAAYFRFEETDAAGRPTRDRRLDTVGLRVIRDPAPERLDFEVEVMGQTGEVSQSLSASAATLDVRAGFVHADVGYTHGSAWRPRVSAEVDYASGDDEAASYGRFDTLFGMRRADLAPAGLYNAIGRANLISAGVRLEATPSTRWDAMVSYRALWLASETDSFSTTGVRDASGASGRFAGRQLDARARYWIVPNALRAEANLVWLDAGDFLRDAPNATGAKDTTYLSLNLTASF